MLGMKDHFDLIAFPKGHVPGGPVQASDGSWYFVLPASVDLARSVEMIEQMRSGRPVSSDEIDDLRARLNVENGTEKGQEIRSLIKSRA